MYRAMARVVIVDVVCRLDATFESAAVQRKNHISRIRKQELESILCNKIYKDQDEKRRIKNDTKNHDIRKNIVLPSGAAEAAADASAVMNHFVRLGKDLESSTSATTVS